MKKIHIILLAFTLVFTACSTIIPYKTKEKISIEEAKSSVKSLLYAQYPGHIPGDVVVNSKYIKTFYAQQNIAKYVLIFQHINSIQIKENTKWLPFKFKTRTMYVVDILDNNGLRIVKYFMRSEADAKALVNAIEVLRHAVQPKNYEY